MLYLCEGLVCEAVEGCLGCVCEKGCGVCQCQSVLCPKKAKFFFLLFVCMIVSL